MITVVTRIGIDVGGVIIDSLGNDGTDTSFHGDDFMKTTAVAGVFDAIKKLIERFGAENVFIVSKCGAVIENKTRVWLANYDFYAYTGFLPENLYFCLRRADKAPIVQRLEITDFIDDHAEVLKYMEGIVPNRYLFGPQPVSDQDLDGLILVEEWQDTFAAIVR